MLAAFFMLYVLLVLGLALRRKRSGAILFLVGVILLMGSAVNDILKGYHLDFFGGHAIMPFGLLLFLCCQSAMLTRRFSVAFDASENLSPIHDGDPRTARATLSLRAGTAPENLPCSR